MNSISQNNIKDAVQLWINDEESAITQYGHISNWDVSQVTDMSDLFSDKNINENIENWDVSNVTNMNGMFSGATHFNQPLNNWDVSQVTNMAEMFYEATNFNQPLNNWDVSQVTNMSHMFCDAIGFNQSLNNWNVSQVTNMRGMFVATHFNQPLNNWNVSNVTDMNGMFVETTSFNQPLNDWDVSNVTNMNRMFYGAIQFNQPLDNWNVSQVTEMQFMFYNAPNFNQPLNNWDVSQVNMHEIIYFGEGQSTNMESMFLGATSFNQDLSSWNRTYNPEQSDIIFASDSDSDSGSGYQNDFESSIDNHIFSNDSPMSLSELSYDNTNDAPMSLSELSYDNTNDDPMSLSELSDDNKTIPAEPLNPIAINQNRLSIHANSIGSDIIMGGEGDKTTVSDFISESQTDGDIPIIMKLLDKNKKEHDSIYLFTQDNLKRILEDSIVYPCWQNTGYYNVINDDTNNAPEGVIQNVRDNIQLYSMNNVFQRNILTEFSTLQSYIESEPELKTPIFIVFVPTTNFYESISKLPFSAGVSQLHCNPGSSDTLMVYSIQNGNYVNQSASETGGSNLTRRKLKTKITKNRIKKRNKQKSKLKTKKRNKSKSKKRNKSKTKKRNKSKTKKRNKSKN